MMHATESIVVSLEMAQKLKEAGWPQGWTGVFSTGTLESVDQMLPSGEDWSYFKWFEHPETKEPLVSSLYCNYAMICAAPTAEEILRMLPKRTELFLCGDGAKCGNERIGMLIAQDTLSNAAAAMYCYLQSQNLL
jgi:hypothetical protein